MNSAEGVSPPHREIEKNEQEVDSSSLEVLEFSIEDLETHIISTELQIEQEVEKIVSEGEKKLELYSSSLGVSPETFNVVAQDFELERKLEEVQTEAELIGDEAKSELDSVREKLDSKEIIELQKKTPEEIKQERRMKIIKEIEKEWEEKNGPMHMPLSEKEIKENKEVARLWGKEWDGFTTRLTEAASEFFFDHSGKGKSSVPGRADKILVERFPEYAQKSEQLVTNEENKEVKNIEETITINKVEKPKYEIEEKLSEELIKVFTEVGIKSKTVKIENNGEFSEAILLQKNEISTEKMVRIYRGINHLDASVLEQIPYAMRKEKEGGKPIVLENVRQEVDTLAESPTYENLLTYVDKVRQSLSPKEVRYMEEDLLSIENGILEGNSTRKELMYKQIGHGGGWGQSGITPYLSASFNPYEAAGYAGEGLIVMDVPLSALEDFQVDNREVNLKGALDKKYITAILPRKLEEATADKEKRDQRLYQALQKVYELAEVPLYDDEELRSEREKKFAESAELDKEQQKKDAEKVRQKRVEKLTTIFPEMKINFQDEQKKSRALEIDPYTKVKKDIFDYYKIRLEKIGRNGMNIDDYDYSESEYGERKIFDREKTTESMLIKLRELTSRLEERQAERQRG